MNVPPMTDERRFRHALRNSLHCIGLCIEMLAMETDPAASAGWLEEIARAAEEGDHAMEGLSKSHGYDSNEEFAEE